MGVLDKVREEEERIARTARNQLSGAINLPTIWRLREAVELKDLRDGKKFLVSPLEKLVAVEASVLQEPCSRSTRKESTDTAVLKEPCSKSDEHKRARRTERLDHKHRLASDSGVWTDDDEPPQATRRTESTSSSSSQMTSKARSSKTSGWVPHKAPPPDLGAPPPQLALTDVPLSRENLLEIAQANLPHLRCCHCRRVFTDVNQSRTCDSCLGRRHTYACHKKKTRLICTMTRENLADRGICCRCGHGYQKDDEPDSWYHKSNKCE